MSDVVPTHIFDLTPEALTESFKAMGLPAFRSKQVLQWIYEKQVDSWDAMTNLGKADRIKLAEHFTICQGQTVRHQLATDGVQKLLVDWSGAKLPVVTNTNNQTE